MHNLQGVPGRAAALFCAGAVVFLAQGVSGQIVVDGRFDDWAGISPAASDPAGDASGGFDLTTVSVTSRGTVLYLRFDTGATLNLQSGPREDGTLILRVATGPDCSVEIDMRNRTYVTRRPESVEGWSAVDYHAAPTTSANTFEIALDAAGLGAAVGDELDITFAGSDALDTPIAWRLASPATPAVIRSPVRAPEADVRIVSLNTRKTGLRDAERRGPLLRLLRGPRPDIITIQEEYDTNAAEIATLLNRDVTVGGTWHVHKQNDCVIAAGAPLVPVHAYDRSYAAALVPRGGGTVLLVLSIHPKCCGYAGSREDRRRIEQTRAMIRTIGDARRVVLGEAAGDATPLPVVVIGDWNLVGSPTPVDLFRDDAGLLDLPLLDLFDRRTVTWRDETSAFAPGRLDLVVYDPAALTPRGGFVVDTAHLPDETLRALHLRRADSAATDHLLLVADFDLSP